MAIITETTNTNVRLYGNAPYKVAVIHGGPGAAGSMRHLAWELSSMCSVIEPLQSKYNIQSLVRELDRQLNASAEMPMILIGHSWGAWLSIIYATHYPENVTGLILVGCPPFEDRYVPAITENRIRRLGTVMGTEFRQLLYNMSNGVTASDMERLERLVEKSDNCHTIPGYRCCRPDSRMYESVWKEAATLRTEGKIKEMISHLHCPLYFIHGCEDPHPLEGITMPLDEMHIRYHLYTLENCGHSPFLETEIHDTFCSLLYKIINNINKHQ